MATNVIRITVGSLIRGDVMRILAQQGIAYRQTYRGWFESVIEIAPTRAQYADTVAWINRVQDEAE